VTEPPVFPPGWYAPPDDPIQRRYPDAAADPGTVPATVSTLNGLAVLCAVLAANALIVGVVERAQAGRAQAHHVINCALGECGVNTGALVQTTAVFALVVAGALALAAIVAFVMANNIADRAAREPARSHSDLGEGLRSR
jgi:hypothetical protein